MKKAADKKQPKVANGEVKVDWSKRETVFEVKHNGVSLDWSANLLEAMATAKATMGAVIYEINRQTGVKRARA